MNSVSPNFQVLVLEDDAGMQSFLQTLLQSQGYALHLCAEGLTGLQLLTRQSFDLILLDLGLPDIDGIELLRQLRQWSDIPVIVISARGKEQDKVTALDCGANDYVTKPFSAGELLARLRAALRPRQGHNPVLSFGQVRVDPVQRLVHKNDELVHLTKTEYEMLLCLLRHAGSALTHNQILSQVWGATYQDRPEYIRVHMAQLRQKLEDNPAAPHYLKTEAGVGYRLCL
jgi:two-component system KDP operon response regulator KdpE